MLRCVVLAWVAVTGLGVFDAVRAQTRSGLDVLTSGEGLKCEAQEGRPGQAATVWPCEIRVTDYDPARGSLTGEVAWTTLDSVHRVRGRVSGQKVILTETDAITAGSASLNVVYTLSVAPGDATGTYTDPNDGGYGSMRILFPPAPAADDVVSDADRTAANAGVAILTSGKSLPCERRGSVSRWPCTIRFTSYDRQTGAITGEVIWPTSKSVHGIAGMLTGRTIAFRETQAIRRGTAALNVAYTMTVVAGSATGTWVRGTWRGSMAMTLR